MTGKRKNRSRGGFSLLELMLVLAILGVLMTVAAVNVLGGQDRANKRATEATLTTISTALKDYKLYKNEFPQTLAELQPEYIDASTSLTDAWKIQLFYAVPGLEGRPFELVSAGPDKEMGTSDDIDYWLMQQTPAATN